MNPEQLRAAGDWLRQLRVILRQGASDQIDAGQRPDAKHRSSRKAVKELLSNLGTGAAAAPDGYSNANDVNRVVFNAVDLLIEDKTSQSRQGKTRLQALSRFRSEVERQFAAQAGSRHALDPAWKARIDEAMRALRKESMSEVIDDCELPANGAPVVELEAALKDQGATLARAMDDFVAFDAKGRSEHYTELYDKTQKLVDEATRADRNPRTDVLAAVAALRAGLHEAVVDSDPNPHATTPEKVTLAKLGSILDKMEQEQRLRSKAAEVPAFAGFPPEDLWRLFIDGNRQRDDEHADFAFDDPVPARNRAGEIGFMAGCMKAFRGVLEHLDEPLTLDMLVGIHRDAVGVVYDDKDVPKEATATIGGPSLPTGVSTATATGFPIRMAALDDDDTGEGNFSAEGLAELLARIRAEIQALPDDDGGVTLPSVMLYTNRGNLAFNLETGEPRALAEGEVIASVRNTSNAERRAQKAADIIDNYTQAMAPLAAEVPANEVDRKALDTRKLRAIVRCVQDIEVLHTFTDGNCRTMICVLNKLLLMNHFDPVILLNPNRLDGLSEDQLLDAIDDGWRNFDDRKG